MDRSPKLTSCKSQAGGHDTLTNEHSRILKKYDLMTFILTCPNMLSAIYLVSPPSRGNFEASM